MKGIDILFQKSINTNLCSGCGICAGICPTQIIKFDSKQLRPTINQEKNCIDCHLCIKCCPAKGYALPDNKKEFADYKYLLKASSKEKRILENSASGGFITVALIHLLKNNYVDKVLIVNNSSDINLGFTSSKLTNSLEMVFKGQKSKYMQSPIHQIVRQIIDENVRVAIVGTPCQIYGIHQLKKLNRKIGQNVLYTFGLFCGYTYNSNFILGLSKQMDIDSNEIKQIDGWRNNGFPGNFEISTKNGNIKSISFDLEHSIDVTFFAQNRCRLCKDCFSNYSDFSIGDYGSWKEKKSLVMVRSDNAKKLFDELKDYLDYDYISDVRINETVLPFMKREKRIKTDLNIMYDVKHNLPIPVWEKTNSKLYLADLLQYKISSFIKRHAKNNINFYLRHPKLMKMVSEFGYLKINKLLIIKILFKLEYIFRGNNHV